jgi:ATP-dependent RNA helicase RhlE
MYKQSYSRSGNRSQSRRQYGGGRGFGGGGGRSSFGGNRGNGGGFGRRIKSFDPSHIINEPQAPRELQEQKPITHTFNDFGLSGGLLRKIEEKGYKTLTPVQDQAIGPILEGRDLIGIANTGTGKTAAFLIPLVEKVLKDKSQKVLIVAPTRELANQIEDELFSFGQGLGLFCVLCIGGASMSRQIQGLRKSPNFVIGTPGRLEDLIRSRYLDLSRFGSVVLDEADLMVDIGFINNIKYIISLLLKDRQSLFFSATIDGKVQDVLRSFVTNPVTVSVKTGDTVDNIEQTTIRVNHKDDKIEQLHGLLIRKEFEKVLLFGRTKHGVQKLSDELVKRGFRADAIHGNKKQSQRTRILESFKRNRIQILLATDVASRGLDIPNVSHVINYDLPESYEAYIHRIGRTGRADKKGVAVTFVN